MGAELSQVVELAYRLLLGWVRGLVNWIWSVLSGEETGMLSAFALHWKAVLAVLLAVGLLADLLVYILRWRPYKVWFRRPVPEPAPGESPEDDEEPDPDDPAENWTDLQLSPLSEIDEGWSMPEEEPPRERAPVLAFTPRPRADDRDAWGEVMEPDGSGYGAYEAPAGGEAGYAAAEASGDPYDPYNIERTPVGEPGPQSAGTSGVRGDTIWLKPWKPAGTEPETPRRRRLRESDRPELVSQAERRRARRAAAERTLPEDRPERLVVPPPEEGILREDSRGRLQTVTGKPAVRRGLMRLAASGEEPIAGLPPMEVEGGGFRPAVDPQGQTEG